ncbi:hypothetical protein B0H13DRAFT_1853013 [Mycena leptocephala]|nr:hypothetical protein B0H13DRAFT_1853013 [Mycena leptocephala]
MPHTQTSFLFYQGAAHLPPPLGAPGHFGPTEQPATPAKSSLESLPTTSPSPSKSLPKKRGPGRPRKNSIVRTTTKSVPAAEKAAKATTAKNNAKCHAKKNADKENQPITGPQVPINISDSDSETEDGGRKQWFDMEKTMFFTWLLGSDAEANQRFEQHKKNPPCVQKAFEFFTGKGGGDPDSDEPAAILKQKLDGARKAGLAVGTLKPSVIELWDKNGWRDLFNGRLGASAKVSREVVRNSTCALSDVEEEYDNTIDPLLFNEDGASHHAPKTPAPAKDPATVVSEPKFMPSSKFRTQASNWLGNMGEFMKIKMLSERKKSKAMEAKLELDKAKLELEKRRVEVDTQKGKVEMAR